MRSPFSFVIKISTVFGWTSVSISFGTTAGDTNGPICALMVALYITQDSFGTACNISGDNAIGIVVDSIYKKFILKEDTVEA